MDAPEKPSPCPHRSWRVIAQELSHTLDREKVLQLSIELNDALTRRRLTDRPPEPFQKKTA